MAGVYDSMAATFFQNGLNLESITAVRQLYGNLDTQPEPLFYEHFPTPLLPGAVRLVVLQPELHSDLVRQAQSACQDVLASVPPGTMLSQYKVTQYKDTFVQMKIQVQNNHCMLTALVPVSQDTIQYVNTSFGKALVTRNQCQFTFSG